MKQSTSQAQYLMAYSLWRCNRYNGYPILLRISASELDLGIRAHLHMLDEIVEQGIALGLLLLVRADRDVQTHDNHAHQTALEFVPQKLWSIAGHGL